MSRPSKTESTFNERKRMKKWILLAAFAGALSALAQAPTFTTLSANGDATAGAAVIFPAKAGQQIRLVSLNWNSDSNAAVASITTGAGAYYARLANASSSAVTNQINSTNGLVASSALVVERAGVPYRAIMSSFNSNAAWGNYVVLASGGFGVQTVAGDPIYQMSSATTLPIGATTNSMQGFAIYVGNPGRPVRVQITPSAVTNKINAAVALYETP